MVVGMCLCFLFRLQVLVAVHLGGFCCCWHGQPAGKAFAKALYFQVKQRMLQQMQSIKGTCTVCASCSLVLEFPIERRFRANNPTYVWKQNSFFVEFF